MSVLVTVGTTLFDDLIEEIDKLKPVIFSKGYNEIICQIGNGKYIPNLPNFKMISNLERFILSADLIISHAGAGTILDVLRLNKKLIVVVNPKLMNNHQLEIAEVLHNNKHLLMCSSPTELAHVIENLENFTPIPLPSANSSKFVANMITLLNT